MTAGKTEAQGSAVISADHGAWDFESFGELPVVAPDASWGAGRDSLRCVRYVFRISSTDEADGCGRPNFRAGLKTLLNSVVILRPISLRGAREAALRCYRATSTSSRSGSGKTSAKGGRKWVVVSDIDHNLLPGSTVFSPLTVREF